MFFLLRTAFWISVVLVLLPTGETKPQAEAAKVGAVDAISAATSAVADVGQFCSRNPDACVTGTQAAVAFGQRAQAGARMVYDFLSERLETGSVGSGADKKAAEAKPEKQPAGKPQGARSGKPAAKGEKTAGAGARSQHTLKSTDLTPAYRTPQPGREAARSEAAKPEPRDKRG